MLSVTRVLRAHGLTVNQRISDKSLFTTYRLAGVHFELVPRLQGAGLAVWPEQLWSVLVHYKRNRSAV